MKRYEYGFTLIELLVIMGLMAICMLIVWPSLERTFQEYLLKTAAANLAGELRQARCDAIIDGKYCYVRFYADDSYRGSGKRIILPAQIEIKAITFTTCINSTPVCMFTATGAPGGGGTVALANHYGKVKYVIVNPVIGRVRISDQPPAHWQ